MSNIMGSFMNGLAGGVTGFLEGGPAGAAVGGLGGFASGMFNNPSGGGNISSATDGTLGAQQAMDKGYEWANLGMQGQEMAHQLQLQSQSQQFNDVQNEKSEQMRETNTLRTVAMKQREADDKIVKEFIKTVGGE